LFLRAQFRESENRTIFNTPNPRLMNVSLMKDSKFFGEGGNGQKQRKRRRESFAAAASAVAALHVSPPSPNASSSLEMAAAGEASCPLDKESVAYVVSLNPRIGSLLTMLLLLLLPSSSVLSVPCQHCCC
jgi:hypothetical protein